MDMGLEENGKVLGGYSFTDGHDVISLSNVLNKKILEKKLPTAIIANTNKGKGISFIENTNEWHQHL